MWFEVDKQGLGRLLERRGNSFVLFELVQNAWDEQTTRVDVRLERIAGTRRVRLSVEDDNADGFADLSHAFTLFADRSKKADVSRRGRFNLGEKLVLALCDEAEIASTKGVVRFDDGGRHLLRRKRQIGSRFDGILRMTDAEMAECENAMRRLIPPGGIETVYNDELLLARQSAVEFTASLLTEVADADGVLRKATRQTAVRIVEPHDGEVAMLYEMGIPVVETGYRRHVDVQQKVPLNFDRDNVPSAYLSRVRALVLEHMATRIEAGDANAGWVREAVQSHGQDLAAATLNRVLDLRFGEKRVAYDPSDIEANNRAVAQGFTLIHGAQMSKTEWESARRRGAVLPAGQVTPSPKPFSPNGEPLKTLPRDRWTPAIAGVVAYAERLGLRLLGVTVDVTIANDVTWPFLGTFGGGRLVLNLGRLGHRWFEGDLTKINELLIHEFGHHYSGNHLSADYHDALCRLGAALAQLALESPEFFVWSTPTKTAGTRSPRCTENALAMD